MKKYTSSRTSAVRGSETRAIRDPGVSSAGAGGKYAWIPAFAGMTLLFSFSNPLYAQDDAARMRLAACLQKADKAPDQAAAEADIWLKQGGGEYARLCRAFASFDRGAFALAAQDFAALAANRADPKRAALLHAQAGMAWARANDVKNAEAEYAAALRLETENPDFWVDRAVVRAGAGRYWDAIKDINQALAIMPDMPEALRLRGQVWEKLNFPRNAEADIARAVEIEAQDKKGK